MAKRVHPTSGKTYWVACVNNVQKGAFNNQEDAAKMAANMAKCSMKDLIKEQRYDSKELAARIRILTQIYDNGKAIPGDLEHAIAHTVKASKDLFTHEPAAELMSIWGKYGPWKDALVKEFKKGHGGRDSKHLLSAKKQALKKSVQERAGWLFGLVAGAVESMNHMDLEAWTTNVGRNVQHHQGFVPTLLRSGIIGKAEPVKRTSKRKVLNLNGSPDNFEVLRDAESKVKSMAALTEIIHLADAMAEVRKATPAPTTCATWMARINALLAVTRHTKQHAYRFHLQSKAVAQRAEANGQSAKLYEF